MSEVKKAPAKSSKPSSGGDSKDPLWGVIGFLIVAFVLMSLFGVSTFLNNKENYNDPDTNRFSISRIVPKGEIELGKKVINRKLIEIRQSVGGSIIGEQAKRLIGKVVEGPVDKFDKRWWRVDYENAPDGWVTEDDITSKLATFRFFNIFPILYDFFKPIMIVISIIFLIIILVIKFLHGRLKSIEERKKELAEGKAEEVEDLSISQNSDIPINLPTGDDVPKVAVRKNTAKNTRWEHVKTLIDSRNESDWRQAIMEADIILDNMLDRMGYEGEGVGEKLKKIEESDFLTLKQAWDAHRVRNKIAHGGTQFYLDKNEAERVIKLYQKVFEEFYYI